MDKPIDLRDSMVGHVILWTKGWYQENNQRRTVERLSEVINTMSGMSEDNVLGVRELLGYLMHAASILQIDPRSIAEAIARDTAFSNKRMTSYHTQMQDSITMDQLVSLYAGLVSCGQINKGDQPIVLLPELVDGVRKKYQLTRFFNKDI